MYIKEVWLEESTAPSVDELKIALARLQHLSTTLPTLSKFYLYDVVRVMSLLQYKINESKPLTPMPLPNEKNFLPVIKPTDTLQVCAIVLQPAVNLDAASYYLYIVALETFDKTITFKVNDKQESRTRLSKLMTRFSSECKFKKTADLFIWVLLFLKLPPWLTCALANDERPYAYITRCYTSETNPLVQPFIKESVEDLLAQRTGYEQFCIIAALALELTDHNSKIAFNKQLLQVDKNIPHLAVTRRPFTSSAEKEYEFGYVHDDQFYVYEDPFNAVQAWSLAVDASSAFSEVSCDEMQPSFDNAFLKFLQ